MAITIEIHWTKSLQTIVWKAEHDGSLKDLKVAKALNDYIFIENAEQRFYDNGLTIDIMRKSAAHQMGILPSKTLVYKST